MTGDQIIAAIVFALVNLAAAGSGGAFRPGPWYRGLDKPSWTPPDWAFPVTWSVLYSLNGYAGWLIWDTAGAAAWPALAVYAVSLVINALWSALVFGARRLDWGMIDVTALWLSIAAVMVLFWPISRLAALVLIPYLIWVSIAAALNASVLRRNGAAPRP